MSEYPLAPDPIFWTIQGEAHLRGFQMAFVRLAGCSVGCPQCDTDYHRGSVATADEIADRVGKVIPPSAIDRWVWITGGEPTDHDLVPLLNALHSKNVRIALATSGVRPVIPPVDWLSVSPHDPERWEQRYGNEVKIVPGLNGHRIEDYFSGNVREQRFFYQYVQPLSVNGKEDPDSLAECLWWCQTHPNWSLSRQDHLMWGVA